MYGPSVQGDSLDIFGDQIVTGSSRNRDVMQMFSLSKKKMENEFTYSSYRDDHEAGFVLATRFSNDGNYIISGGAGKNELKVFHNSSETHFQCQF